MQLMRLTGQCLGSGTSLHGLYFPPIEIDFAGNIKLLFFFFFYYSKRESQQDARV